MQIYPRPWSIGGKCLFLCLLIGAIILVEWLHRKPTTSNLIAEESSSKVVPEPDPDEAELPLSKLELPTDIRLRLFDRDHNGTLDRDEWAREQQYLRNREAEPANQASEVIAAAARRVATLAKYDLNHDGRLDDDELYQSLVDLNRRPPTNVEPKSEVRRRIVLPISSGTPHTSDKRQDPITEKPEKQGDQPTEKEPPTPRRRIVLPTNPDQHHHGQ